MLILYSHVIMHTSHWLQPTVGLENFTTEKVHEYVFSTIIDSFHELNIHDWVVYKDIT